MRLLLAGLLLVATRGFMAADDSERIEGVITAVHRNDFVLSTESGPIVVDMSDLDGVTAASASGQRIAVIGAMLPGGQTFHAIRLESAREAQ